MKTVQYVPQGVSVRGSARAARGVCFPRAGGGGAWPTGSSCGAGWGALVWGVVLWGILCLGVAGLPGSVNATEASPVNQGAGEGVKGDLGAGGDCATGEGGETPEGAKGEKVQARSGDGAEDTEETDVDLGPRIARLRELAGGVKSLIEGDLPVEVELHTLFDVDVTEPRVVEVEARRLRAVVAKAEAGVIPGDGVAQVGEPAPGVGDSKESPEVPGEEGGVVAVAVDGGVAEGEDGRREVDGTPGKDHQAGDLLTPPTGEFWAARIELDRARLQFYELDPARREAITGAHLERQRQARESQVKLGLDEAERKSREAEAARLEALEEAERARSEAERLLAEEMARLHQISRSYADFEAQMVRRRLALNERAEQTLTLRRRVREILAKKLPDPLGTDRLYDELRLFLVETRVELDDAISESFAESRVLPVGDSMEPIPQDVDRTQVEATRLKLEDTRGQLVAMEAEYRRDHGDQLYEEARALNSDRLSMLPRLSSEKGRSVTGFTSAGLEQAGAELQHIGLVLRYHLVSARHWLVDLGNTKGDSVFATSFTAIKWLVLIFLFWWWRRRGGDLLEGWQQRLYQEQQRARAPEPTRLYRTLGFLQQVRRPLEWLLFGWLLVWVLPDEVSSRIEIQLITIGFTWILAGSVAVQMIDTMAGWKSWMYLDVFRTVGVPVAPGRVVRPGKKGKGAPRGSKGGDKGDETGTLRLRSLQFVGRTVVVIGLILSLSAELVGKGTVYDWIFFICWFAAIPVVLVIVGWWRGEIFQRISATSKKTPFHQWVMTHQEGWRSFLAAVSAGVYLFTMGAVRIIRGWLTGFDLFRRAHAYLFRRGMDRLAQEQKASTELRPLDPQVFTLLGPETESTHDVPGSLDEKLDQVVAQIARHRGGVYGVAGERGCGKTTVLRRVGERSQKDVIMLDCPLSGLDGLREMLAVQLDMDRDSTLEECARKLDGLETRGGILIDHAHRLVQPVMGGLAEFDELMQVARTHSTKCAWVLAFNEANWNFLERARGSRPMFDDVVIIGPWREEEIVELIESRCRQAGIVPRFDHLLDKAVREGDREERAKALERVVIGYYRLIWDYSMGNAGVALHTWRSSLGVDSRGQVRVKLFQVPETRELEFIPDYGVFVLRAVIQLEPALPAHVMEAIMLGRARVENLLRYGVAHGYFEEHGGRYRVAWGWYRPITRFLQRHHLLSKL